MRGGLTDTRTSGWKEAAGIHRQDNSQACYQPRQGTPSRQHIVSPLATCTPPPNTHQSILHPTPRPDTFVPLFLKPMRYCRNNRLRPLLPAAYTTSTRSRPARFMLSTFGWLVCVKAGQRWTGHTTANVNEGCVAPQAAAWASTQLLKQAAPTYHSTAQHSHTEVVLCTLM